MVTSCSNYKTCWNDFIEHPDGDGLNALKKKISKKENICDLDYKNYIHYHIRLFALIENGNKSALEASFLISKCFDGGELEDYLRSLGVFFEKEPLYLLQAIKKGEVKMGKFRAGELRDILPKLPLSTADNFELKLLMIENRIKILQKINNPELEGIRKNGLTELNKLKKQFLHIIEEDKSK